MKVQYVSPSYKRPGKTKTDIWCDDVFFAVHENEKDEYLKFNKNIMVLSDDAKGNMAKVRNEILDKCDCDILVMLDDDVSEVGYYEELKWNNMNFKEFNKKVIEWALQAEELGTVLFGINLQSDPKFYREYSPMSFASPVLGTLTCLLTKTKLRYDERLGLNEDYDLALQVLQKHHKILRWNKYSYKADHLNLAGGCGAYRVLSEEKKQAELMIKKWGKKAVRYDFSKSTNPSIKSPFRGI